MRPTFRQTVAVTTPELVGYWRPVTPLLPREGMPKGQDEWFASQVRMSQLLPDPHRFVDPGWLLNERHSVATHLERGTLVNQYRGHSPCRFCGRPNGSAELSDGAFCWPEGLAHYLLEHDVRLPLRFVSHVHASPHRVSDAPRPAFDKNGQRDRTWPGEEFAELLWTPEDPGDGEGLSVEVDSTWWETETWTVA
jgi:hypothetical protein